MFIISSLSPDCQILLWKVPDLKLEAEGTVAYISSQLRAEFLEEAEPDSPDAARKHAK